MCVLDVKAVLDDNSDKKYVDIEMQLTDKKNTEKRMLYYWAKAYEKQIHSSEQYKKLRKTIGIFILNYVLNKNEEDFLSEYGILKKHANGREVQLTNDLELYIIELPKLEEKLERGEQIENKKLQTWLKFIINPNEVEETDMEENKELKKAAEELEYISEDEHERFLAEQRMEFIRLEKDLKDAGREEASREIAKNMLKKDMDIELIEEITGLTKEEIEKLK